MLPVPNERTRYSLAVAIRHKQKRPHPSTGGRPLFAALFSFSCPLVLSRSLTHLRHVGLGALLHFFRGNVFDMLRESPLMTKGITHFAVAIAPELVRKWHFDLGAGFHRAVEHYVHVFGVDDERTTRDGIGARSLGNAGKFVTEHQARVANLQFGVTDSAAGASHAPELLGLKNLLIVINGFGSILT